MREYNPLFCSPSLKTSSLERAQEFPTVFSMPDLTVETMERLGGIRDERRGVRSSIDHCSLLIKDGAWKVET
jgi:hypothetical protein